MEPLTGRERDLILLALMKAGGDESRELLVKLSDPTAALVIQRPRQRKKASEARVAG